MDGPHALSSLARAPRIHDRDGRAEIVRVVVDGSQADPVSGGSEYNFPPEM